MNPTMTIFAAAALCVPLLACDKQQEAEYPEGAGASYPYGAQTSTGSTGASTGAGTGGATGTTPAIHASPLPPGAAVLSSPILKGTAQNETAGMTEDGGAFGATFAEGQIHEHPFQIQPGRCYSVVGLGVGLTELDVEIVVHQPPAPEWVAAVDGSTGPHAILGGKGDCFKNPFPVGAPAKIRLKATAGSGVAVAQLYSR